MQYRLMAKEHVSLTENPLIAADILAKVWIDSLGNEPGSFTINVMDCEFLCERFFLRFVDNCDEQGLLVAMTRIVWAMPPASFSQELNDNLQAYVKLKRNKVHCWSEEGF